MSRIKLTLAYDGTEFCGWQFQPGTRTVQGALERAISRIVKQPVRVHGSGRTDTGVHALGQVAHFDVPDGFASIPWRKALNPNLPRDARVLSAEPVDAEFHARYSAKLKTYSYVLWQDRFLVVPQRRRYVWGCGELDLAAMDAAAVHLLGEHDFAAFQNAGTVVKSTVRTITTITHEPGFHEKEVIFRFSATGFLKQMVRNLVGCLVKVGRGMLAPEEVLRILESRDRTQAPPTAPPRGLTLEQVEY